MINKKRDKISSKKGTRACTLSSYKNQLKSKRSQITIFVIVAILLVAGILLTEANRDTALSEPPTAESLDELADRLADHVVETRGQSA